MTMKVRRALAPPQLLLVLALASGALAHPGHPQEGDLVCDICIELVASLSETLECYMFPKPSDHRVGQLPDE